MSARAIIIYLILLSIFCFSLYRLIISRRNKLFTSTGLEAMISTPSRWRTHYASPCDSAISGDPSVGDNWVKIIFHCPASRQVSTFALDVLADHSWGQIISEFARVVGFSETIVFDPKQWRCFINTEIPTLAGWHLLAQPKQSLDCYETD